MPSHTKHDGPHDECDNPNLHEHLIGGPYVVSDMEPGMRRARIFTASERYAGLRMPQITTLYMDAEMTEVLHDAVMAAYQAGAMGEAEGLTVEDAIERMADPESEVNTVSSTPTIHIGPFAPSDGVTPRIYLDLSTSVVTAPEMAQITEAPPRVIEHEYGAWVHVPPAEADEDQLAEDYDEAWVNFPNLRLVLLKAREMGAYWINLDADGYDTIASLPTFTW
jgi:hypothetical protein